MSNTKDKSNPFKLLGMDEEYQRNKSLFGGASKEMSEEWSCLKCTCLNKGYLSLCGVCGNAKPIIDHKWNCPTCTFLNEPQSNICSMCNNTKSVEIIIYIPYMLKQ